MHSAPDTKGGTAPGSGPVTPAFNPPDKITLYHWLVVILASAGWLFDCMGQRIFVLSREPAMRELLGNTATDYAIKYWGGLATLLMMVGWATGGILFGMMSDKYGRVKAMVATLLAYTLFSGLSGFAQSVPQFLVFRFIFGVGVGGMFGAATTLVAESVPRHFRTLALGSMQALSACGNMIASGLSLTVAPPGRDNLWGHYSGWQVLSFISVFPALLAGPMIFILKEPQPWLKAKADAAAGKGKSVGSIPDLFSDARWRRNTLVGICLGVSGMVGLWGIAFFSPELISTAMRHQPLQQAEILRPEQVFSELHAPTNAALAHLKAQLSPTLVQAIDSSAAATPVATANASILVTEFNHLIHNGVIYDAAAYSGVALKKRTQTLVELTHKHHDPEATASLNRQLLEQLFPQAIVELQPAIDRTKSRGMLLQDVGSLFGMLAFTFVASYFQRRTAFLLSFLLCFFSVAYVFYALQTPSDASWMLPLMGFATLSCFAGYSIYFPEIFPTRLRGTGVGFCYNTVRYLAAPFPFMLGWMSSHMPFRHVAMIMSAIYFVGIIALIWAPETKGKPLPED